MAQKIQSIPLSKIRIDGGTQSRERLDQDVVSEYAEKIKAGADFPPLYVFSDGSDYWLVDGFHRYFARKQLGDKKLDCMVESGSQREAQLESYSVNDSHGLRRSNADKRKAVLGALENPISKSWSDNKIATHCGVGRQFVVTVKSSVTCNQTTSEPVYRTYTTKHGTVARMDVSKIGKSQPRLRQLTNEEESLLRSTSEPCVYVLVGENQNTCKVGWSRHPLSRVSALLTGNPYATLAALAPGEMRHEKQVHALIESQRDAGEWFLCSVEDALEAVRAVGLTPITKHGTEAVMNTDNIGENRRANPAEKTPDPAPFVGADDHDDMPTLDEIVNDLQAENTRLIAEIRAMEADDQKAETLKWRKAYEASERSKSELMDRAHAAAKREKWSTDQLRRIGRAVGVTDPRKIAAAVEKMAKAVTA